MAGQLLTMPLNNNNSNSNSNLNSCTQNQTTALTQQIGSGDGATTNSSILTTPIIAVKKQGVSGESCDLSFGQSSRDILIRKFEKDFR